MILGNLGDKGDKGPVGRGIDGPPGDQGEQGITITLLGHMHQSLFHLYHDSLLRRALSFYIYIFFFCTQEIFIFAFKWFPSIIFYYIFFSFKDFY